MPLLARLIKAACRAARCSFGSPAVQITLTLADGRRCDFACCPEPPTPPPKNRKRICPATLALSADTKRIVRVVAADGPIEAKNIPAAAGIDRSKCYVLVADLAERGAIRETVDGYVLIDTSLAGD